MTMMCKPKLMKQILLQSRHIIIAPVTDFSLMTLTGIQHRPMGMKMQKKILRPMQLHLSTYAITSVIASLTIENVERLAVIMNNNEWIIMMNNDPSWIGSGPHYRKWSGALLLGHFLPKWRNRIGSWNNALYSWACDLTNWALDHIKMWSGTITLD